MKLIMLASGTIKSTLTYRLLSFARCLVLKGHSVTIIAPSMDKYSGYKKEIFNEIDGVKIIRPFQFNTKNRLINLLPYMLHALIILHKESYDLIHLYKPTPITIPGIIPRFTRRKKVIVDMDDLGSKVMIQERNSFLIVKLVELCESIALRHADGIICASNYLKSKYTKMFPGKEIIWVSNGIDAEYVTKRKLSKVRKAIVAIGSLNRENIIKPLITVIPEVIRSIKISHPFVYIIGDGLALPNLKKLVLKLGIEKYVKFTGWISMKEIPKYTKYADVGYAYMPDEETIKACSNLKAFQYMAMGMTPLVSNVGDLPLYVDKGNAGFIVDANNEKALAESIIEIFNSTDRIAKAEHALRFVKDKYTWELLITKVENFYKKVI